MMQIKIIEYNQNNCAFSYNNTFKIYVKLENGSTDDETKVVIIREQVVMATLTEYAFVSISN